MKFNPEAEKRFRDFYFIRKKQKEGERWI